MTPQDLHDEWLYIFSERLGILCGVREPTAVEREMARKDADNATETLKNE